MPVQMVDERLWAGSEASLVAMLDAQKAIVERTMPYQSIKT